MSEPVVIVANKAGNEVDLVVVFSGTKFYTIRISRSTAAQLIANIAQVLR